MVLVALNTSMSDTMQRAINTDQMILSPLNIFEKKPPVHVGSRVFGPRFDDFSSIVMLFLLVIFLGVSVLPHL